jgi:hypothetical protein
MDFGMKQHISATSSTFCCVAPGMRARQTSDYKSGEFTRNHRKAKSSEMLTMTQLTGNELASALSQHNEEDNTRSATVHQIE